ncbi:tetratricopeptide repeat protein [Nocardia sp. NPDC051570]|uniref:tetratricopeptide repeat protein n=1 Tax=Nocardia sp. NPDC051570 TaxID=3364324 RepID=UPI0037BDDFE4
MSELLWSEAEYDAYFDRRDASNERARERMTALVAERTRVVGADHLDTLTARRDLLADLIRWRDDALGDGISLTADCLRVLGPDHQVTIAVRALVAAERIEQADVDEPAGDAVRMLASLVEQQTDLLGPAHPDTLRMRLLHVEGIWRDYKLRLGYKSGDRRFEEFEAHAAQWAALVADHVRLLGADHPDTLRCRDKEAMDYCEFGEHDAELRCYTALVADRTRLLGSDHPDTLASRENHLTSLSEVGGKENHALADRLHVDLVTDCLRVLGRDHWTTQSVLSRNDLRSV